MRGGKIRGGEPDDTPDESRILEEFKGDPGLLLLGLLHAVTLWAATDPARRGGLFSAETARKHVEMLRNCTEPQLDVSLATLVALVADPASADPEIISLACLKISEWAQERGAYGTALAYTQGAALASPEDAGPAHTVGSLALRRGRSPRAETWLRRTIGLARRGKDWPSYAQACVDLGTLYARCDRPTLARRYFVQAMRTARRHGLLRIRAAALHGLFLLAMQAGELDDAERYARGAVRAYGREISHLPVLLHDIAYLLITRENYGRAIPMLQRQLVSRTEPAERAFTLAVLARAAAGAGERRLYEEAWSGSWSLINRPGAHEAHARALLELARAAALLPDWSRVVESARCYMGQSPARTTRRLDEQFAELAALARRHLEGTE